MKTTPVTQALAELSRAFQLVNARKAARRSQQQRCPSYELDELYSMQQAITALDASQMENLEKQIGFQDALRMLLESRTELPHYDQKLARRHAEWQFKTAEWHLMRDKILVFTGLAVVTIFVLTVGIVLILGSQSGGIQISLVIACSTLVGIVLRYFRYLFAGPYVSLPQKRSIEK